MVVSVVLGEEIVKPSEQIDTTKMLRQPPGAVIRHHKLRLAADRLVMRTCRFLNHHPVYFPVSKQEVRRRVLLRSAILEVERCLGQS